MILGKNVKKFREKANMSQKELANRVYCTDTMIFYIEKDVKMPSLQLAANIAKALGCTVDELIEEEKSVI